MSRPSTVESLSGAAAAIMVASAVRVGVRRDHQQNEVLENYPHWRDTSSVGLRYLRTADDQVVTEAAVTGPAHWAVHLTEEVAYIDATTGETVDEDAIDAATRWNLSREPEEGRRHGDSVIEKTVWEPEWFCTDYAAAGLTLCDLVAKAGPGGHGAHPDAGQDDQARAAAEAEA